MKPLILLALALVTALVQGGEATLFQNWAREMARNQILHILRHHPDLIAEVIQQQRLQQQLQQQQQQQQQMGLNQNSQLNGNQLRPNQALQPQQQGFNGNTVMGSNALNQLNQQLLDNQLQAEQQQQQLQQEQQQLTYNELVRRTQNRYPNQRFVV